LEQEPLFRDEGVRVKPETALVGKTLDRKRVTRTEVGLAGRVLAAYNEVAGQKLTGQMWLKKIVLRIREHPEMTVEEHRGVIERNFADPWWRGTPTPSVIYGNDAVFERALLATGVREPRTHAERKSARIRKLLGQ
jgi:hypothetical protein